MIPLSYVWGGLCTISIFIVALLLWAWLVADELDDDQSGRNE